jgi:glucosamine-6-phosphate deaminase
MHVHGLTIRRFRTADGAARALADHISRCLADKPDLVLGLPTGRTPVPLYRQLVALFEAGRADYSGATTFNLDEIDGLAPGDPRSYRAFMHRHLFDCVNIARKSVHFLDGSAADLDAECRRYERAIVRAGGIDLLILGLGANGHIGFNEPAVSLAAVTHVTGLTEATRRANAGLFDRRASAVPRRALSMGMGTILRARRIVLLATGSSKASAVRRLVEGRITPRVPASFLQLHPATEVWLDGAAGLRVSGNAR